METLNQEAYCGENAPLLSTPLKGSLWFYLPLFHKDLMSTP